jgi:hypothetical protein
MKKHPKAESNTAPDLLTEWRARHSEFSNEEFEEAMDELSEYLRLAWPVYCHQHPELDLPETL